MALVRRKDNKNRVLKEGESQRANGTYEYKWRDRRGKRHGIYAKTLQELRVKEDEVRVDLLLGVRTAKQSMTINTLYIVWKRLKRGLKDNTFQNYCWLYENYIKPDFGLTRITDLKKTDVRLFYNDLVDKKKLQINTVEGVHTVLHQVLDLAVEDEYLRRNPAGGALTELKKEHSKDIQKRRALTLQEQELLEDYLQRSPTHRRWRPIFTVMLWTGMRVGEVTGLRWEDIDLEKGLISVNHTMVYYTRREKDMSRSTLAINTPKTQAGNRTIPMLPVVKQAFLEEKEYQKKERISGGFQVDGYTGFVFLNRFGHAYTLGSLNNALNRITQECNRDILERAKRDNIKDVQVLPHFTNHTLRHTFTTRMCEAGVNIKAMQDILGHADIETTMNIYADATSDLKRREMDSFEKFFASMQTT